MTDLESDYPKFPYDWDIDNDSQLQYYKKCFSYVKDSKDYDNIIGKSKFFWAYGILAILYMLILSFMLIRQRNHFIFKRQGSVYFLLFMLGSILNATNSFIIQVINYY